MLGALGRGWQKLFSARARKTLSYLDVAKILEEFVNGTGHRWALDNYLVHSFSDPYLLYLQDRMGGLDVEFPAQDEGRYCSQEGIEVIRASIRELRKRAAQQHPQLNISS
jgi:hypothetical protein